MARGIASLILAAVASLVGCNADRSDVRVVPQSGPVEPRRVAFSLEDPLRILVVEKSGMVSLWRVAEGRVPLKSATFFASAMDAAFLPDGRGVVTGGLDGVLRWWDERGRLTRTSEARQSETVRALAVGPRLLVSGGDGGEARIWNSDGVSKGDSLRADSRAVLSLALSARGVLASLGLDQTLRLWKSNDEASTFTEVASVEVVNPRLSPLLEHLVRLDEHWGWGRSLDFSPDGKTLAGAVFDGSIRLWDPTGKLLREPVKGHAHHHVRSVAFSPTGNALASAGHDGKVRLWRPDGEPFPVQISAHSGPAYSVDVSPRGDRLVTTGADDFVRLWGLNGEKLGEISPERKSRIASVDFSADGEVLIAGDTAGSVRLWNLDGSPASQPIQAHGRAVTVVAFGRDGVFATGSEDQTVRLWNRDGSARGKPLRGHVDSIEALAFSPAGNLLASGSRNDTIRVWNLDGTQRTALLGLRDIVGTIAFSPGNDLVVAGSAPHEIEVWNVDGSKKTPPIVAHEGHVFAVAFSPGGDFIASGGRDGLIRFWEPDGRPRGEALAGHRGAIRALAFAPDGSFLATGGEDGLLRIWRLPPGGPPESILVGLPIEQIGVHRSFLWARGQGNLIRFFDLDGRPTANMVLSPETSIVVTADGWYSGRDVTAGQIAFFDGSRRLDGDELESRLSPRQVRAAILREH